MKNKIVYIRQSPREIKEKSMDEIMRERKMKRLMRRKKLRDEVAKLLSNQDESSRNKNGMS